MFCICRLFWRTVTNPTDLVNTIKSAMVFPHHDDPVRRTARQENPSHPLPPTATRPQIPAAAAAADHRRPADTVADLVAEHTQLARPGAPAPPRNPANPWIQEVQVGVRFWIPQEILPVSIPKGWRRTSSMSFTTNQPLCAGSIHDSRACVSKPCTFSRRVAQYD